MEGSNLQAEILALLGRRRGDMPDGWREETAARLACHDWTLLDLAAAYGVTYKSAKAWVEAGRVAAEKVKYAHGRRWRILPEDGVRVVLPVKGRPRRLNGAQVRHIRASKATHEEMAAVYGVSASMVSRIRSGRRYADVL